MLEDNLAKGRFFFANGDFFQGTFKDSQPLVGQYQQKNGAFVKCEQTQFENGVPHGKMDNAQKFSVTQNEKTYIIKGQFTNGQPIGEVDVTVDHATHKVSFEAADFTPGVQIQPETKPAAYVEEEKKPEEPVKANPESVQKSVETAPVQAASAQAAPVEEIKQPQKNAGKKKAVEATDAPLINSEEINKKIQEL